MLQPLGVLSTSLLTHFGISFLHTQIMLFMLRFCCCLHMPSEFFGENCSLCYYSVIPPADNSLELFSLMSLFGWTTSLSKSSRLNLIISWCLLLCSLLSEWLCPSPRSLGLPPGLRLPLSPQTSPLQSTVFCLWDGPLIHSHFLHP